MNYLLIKHVRAICLVLFLTAFASAAATHAVGLTAAGRVIVAVYEGLKSVKSGHSTIKNAIGLLTGGQSELESAKNEIIDEVRKLQTDEVLTGAKEVLLRFSELNTLVTVTDSDLERVESPAIAVITDSEHIIETARSRRDYKQAYLVAKAYNLVVAIRAFCLSRHGNRKPDAADGMLIRALRINHKLLFDWWSLHPYRGGTIQEYTKGIIYRHLWYEAGSPAGDKEKIRIEYRLGSDGVFNAVVQSCRWIKGHIAGRDEELEFDIYDKGRIVKSGLQMKKGEIRKFRIPAADNRPNRVFTAYYVFPGDIDLYVKDGNLNLRSWNPLADYDLRSAALPYLANVKSLRTKSSRGGSGNIAIVANKDTVVQEFRIHVFGGPLEIVDVDSHTGGVSDIRLAKGSSISYQFWAPTNKCKIEVRLYDLPSSRPNGRRPIYYLRSANYPNRYIRHYGFAGRIDPIDWNVELQRNDASFRIVDGLYLPGEHISFESVNYPGYFLRHRDERIFLERYDSTARFAKEASFRRRSGLSGAGVSFESVLDYRGYFVRHYNFELFLHKKEDNKLFRKDATFEMVRASEGDADLECEAIYMPSGAPRSAPWYYRSAGPTHGELIEIDRGHQQFYWVRITAKKDCDHVNLSIRCIP